MQEATAASEFVEANRARLTELIDAVVPSDDYPSASEAGGLVFLQRMLAERLDWIAQAADVVERGDASAHWQWFAELVAGGYYADPGNGGNADAASWAMIDWTPSPGAAGA
ncbi:hypothetical protein [Frondihabitans sp. PAMC 28766]|uniref:hypothetical protein n=1 Tax=Frondihabitans sp. PAMC 28766 TaxID=1795630 RepID=UPI0019501E48|nr:hypothetical protein [Frondihabitans sp. PAMC 28766]